MPLDPEAAVWLDRWRAAPPRASLSVSETRAAYIRSSALAADPAAGVNARTFNITPNLLGRHYWPEGLAALQAEDAPSLLVWLHGGRFFSGGFETHEGLCGALALAGRCHVLAVNYRLAPEHPFPAAIDDALSALAWARGQSPSVALGGDSAGANLAAVAALLDARAHPVFIRRQLIVYPMLDPACAEPSHREFASGYGPGSSDMLRGWRLYLPEGLQARDERISPLFTETLAGSPPAMVITAEYDCLRDEGEVFARRLAAEGARVVHKRYDGAIHGFFQMPKVMRLAREAIADAGAFLREDERPILVSAGILTSGNEVLICQRHHSDPYGMQWEFPGGKVKSGEDSRSALTRELAEELGIEAEPGAEVFRTIHRYPDRYVEVVFFHVPAHRGVLQNRIFEAVKWAPRASLPQYLFLEADKELVARIARGELF